MGFVGGVLGGGAHALKRKENRECKQLVSCSRRDQLHATRVKTVLHSHLTRHQSSQTTRHSRQTELHSHLTRHQSSQTSPVKLYVTCVQLHFTHVKLCVTHVGQDATHMTDSLNPYLGIVASLKWQPFI